MGSLGMEYCDMATKLRSIKYNKEMDFFIFLILEYHKSIAAFLESKGQACAVFGQLVGEVGR